MTKLAYKYSEAGRLWGVSEPVVRQMVKDGVVTAIETPGGGKKLIPIGEVLRVLQVPAEAVGRIVCAGLGLPADSDETKSLPQSGQAILSALTTRSRRHPTQTSTPADRETGRREVSPEQSSDATNPASFDDCFQAPATVARVARFEQGLERDKETDRRGAGQGSDCQS